MTKKISKEGLTIKKEDNFSEWYQQLMIKAKLADYTKVSGCIVLRPKSQWIWETFARATDDLFKKSGIENVNFPMFIPESLLLKEENHVKGFAPEVAWVTHAGKKKLNERLAIRPTSEAIIYDSYAKWIRSHNDLPMRYNQWNSVVRWEFNNPVPFFRTREFQWNEGHSVFASETEAKAEGNDILGMYEKVVSEMMALPSIRGFKTEKEKFAGAVSSEKLHYMMNNGRVIEGPCFHYDGQNFSKAYDIKFTREDGKEDFVYQNTWAVSTRMLGTMFTIHSDNKGLVIPPKLAKNKIIIIPILFGNSKKEILEKTEGLKKGLKNFAPLTDLREDISPGRKFNSWELKGIPLRIELGPKDLEKKRVVVVKRNTNDKIEVKFKDLKKEIPKLLNEMQNELYNTAKKLLESRMKTSENKDEVVKLVKEKNMVCVPMCKNEKCEEKLKEIMPGLKSLFVDSEKKSVENKSCTVCGKTANYWLWVGRTY
ncbi:proline--tRNA ligase [archaeon]|nr:proline--tRNA ligase [archaeon]